MFLGTEQGSAGGLQASFGKVLHGRLAASSEIA